MIRDIAKVWALGFSGIAVSLSEIEQWLRIILLITTIATTIYVARRKKKE